MRQERLSINLFDTDRLIGMLREKTLPLLDFSAAIPMDKDRPEERGVAFTCSLLQAAVVCDIIRSEDRKAGDVPTRIYLKRSPNRAWYKLGSEVILTLDISTLNREVFPSSEPVVIIPPSSPPKRVSFGTGD